MKIGQNNPKNRRTLSYARGLIDKVYEEAFNTLFILLITLPLKGDILEFGVFRGYTSYLFARRIKKFYLKDTSLHLFDSFEGLPDNSGLDECSYESAAGVWTKSSMAVIPGMEIYLRKKLAKILGKERVHVVKGFYEDTLERHFKENPTLKAKIIHIDCDLYSSSKCVLDFVFSNEIIQDGTIIIFDDWMTSAGNPNLGQKKATHEILQKYPSWDLEKYMHYGIGSTVFIAHDLRIADARNK